MYDHFSDDMLSFAVLNKVNVKIELFGLVCVPRGLLGLKIPLLGAFLMFVQNVIMYVTIVVFYSSEFKFTYAIT